MFPYLNKVHRKLLRVLLLTLSSTGLGLGVLCLCCGVGVAYYFAKYRGAASGLSAAGNGVGYVMVPILFSSLSRYFGGELGWRTAVKIYGLVVAFLAFFCALSLRPLEIEPPTEEEIEDIDKIEHAANSYLEHRANGFIKDDGERTEIFASAPWISGAKFEGKERSKHHNLWEKLNEECSNGIANGLHEQNGMKLAKQQ